MGNSKQKTIYVCSECGNETYNWSGKCPSCGSWNSLKEITCDKSSTKNSKAKTEYSVPKKLSEMDTDSEIRFTTGISELDRVLGGGAVCGSMVLVGGSPGIGKSTLLLQMCGNIGDRKILYISGEESEKQIKLRADRLKITSELLYVLAETDLSLILKSISMIQPDVVIIDSIQTIYADDSTSSPGSVSQIRDCTMELMKVTKSEGFTTFIVGHINKEGNIAGPKILEHMVDCVLYFEGDRNTSFRILRAAKNRYGSTNEIGVFEMRDFGLRCVENPSELLLSGRPVNTPGTCVSCIIEGTRPILAEIQALITPSSYNASRRSNGIDYNRCAMLLAVLEKKCGMDVYSCDAYINVVGGLILDDTSADLALILSVASSFFDRPIPDSLVAVGEVGLSGEIRSVSMINQRLSEIARLGFTRCLIPDFLKNDISADISGLELIPVLNVQDAIKAALGKS